MDWVLLGVIIVLIIMPVTHVILDRADQVKQAKKRLNQPYEGPTQYRKGE